ncbi:MAG: hydroxyacylglutathione hydrolase [Actinomycetota bacterium]|nr:hydroxyacylglutathione hydrolase [Actinomycetota bacterium]
MTTQLTTRTPVIEVLDTPDLGDRSYIVGLDGVAVVVDPQRDIERVLAVLQRRDWGVSHVVETHVHNDYVSGGLELARLTGATYVVPRGHDYAFDAAIMGDGDEFDAGAMHWRVVHTPGHTPHHVSYALDVDGRNIAVFTGGSLLYGSVGRPDLISAAATKGLAHDQWRSVRRLVTELDADAAVFPTHGFGSFCSATATVGLESTIGLQAATNPAALLDEDEFVTELIAGLDAFPAYYKHMGPANEAGARAIDLTPAEHADPDVLRARIEAGEWVVDLRSRKVWAAEHLKGSLSFDADGNAITYLGWLIPWGTPITLLGASQDQITEFQRAMVRIGIDRPAGQNVGDPGSWARSTADLGSIRREDFVGLAAALAADPNLIVMDARRLTEWRDGHVAGARHVPLHELPGRIGDVVAWSQAAAHAGADTTVWVSCGSGFRAAVAGSLLARAGVPVVIVDDDFANAEKAGLPIVVDGHAATLGAAYSD